MNGNLLDDGAAEGSLCHTKPSSLLVQEGQSGGQPTLPPITTSVSSSSPYGLCLVHPIHKQLGPQRQSIGSSSCVVESPTSVIVRVGEVTSENEGALEADCGSMKSRVSIFEVRPASVIGEAIGVAVSLMLWSDGDRECFVGFRQQQDLTGPAIEVATGGAGEAGDKIDVLGAI